MPFYGIYLITDNESFDKFFYQLIIATSFNKDRNSIIVSECSESGIRQDFRELPIEISKNESEIQEFLMNGNNDSRYGQDGDRALIKRCSVYF